MSKQPTTRATRCFTQRSRDKIAASALIDRLLAFALGENDPKTKMPVEMTTQQVNAAGRLINKVLPDLKAVEVNDKRPRDSVAALLEAVMDHQHEARKGNGSALH